MFQFKLLSNASIKDFTICMLDFNSFTDEKNPKLKEKYMIFANDYIDRATQIKKVHIAPKEEKENPQQPTQHKPTVAGPKK